MLGYFPRTVRAITEVVLLERIGPDATARAGSVCAFILGQHSRMPDYLRAPLVALTLICDTWPLLLGFWRPLHRLSVDQRRAVIAVWKGSRIGFMRSLIRFYEGLAVYGWAAECRDTVDE
jgi:hypothetical protein